MALGLVEKMVNLLADLFARLTRQKLITLDDARVVRLETVRLARRAERVEYFVAPDHILGIEVSHSARRLKTDFLGHLFYSET